jgi:hypothetical protein
MNRQASRFSVLLKSHDVVMLGVSDFAHKGNGELEAAGNLIDILDATGGEKGVISVNVAVRHGKGKNWPNGTPFGFFKYKQTLIISTIDGYCLSLAKKLGIVTKLEMLDVPKVIDAMIEQKRLDQSLRDHIVLSQFRSYEFVPRVAYWIVNGLSIPSSSYPVKLIPDAPKAVWWVDNFGNVVTTMLPEEIKHKMGTVVQTKFGKIRCYNRLKDVPDGKTGLIIGSWGIENKRFVSLVIQGKSAAQQYSIRTGDTVI